jgi:hypothetical protein
MNDIPPRNRRFWQIHLSTSMALLVAIGGLWGANLLLYSDMEQGFGDSAIPTMLSNSFYLLSVLIQIVLLLFVAIAFEFDARRRSKP